MSLLAFSDMVSDLIKSIAVFRIVEKVFSFIVLIGLKIVLVSLVTRSSTKALSSCCPILYDVIRYSLVSFGA